MLQAGIVLGGIFPSDVWSWPLTSRAIFVLISTTFEQLDVAPLVFGAEIRLENIYGPVLF